MAIVAAYTVLTIPGFARAAKWSKCPAPPVPVYPSVQGATTSPFIQPGRQLTIVLNEDEVAAGAFSLIPDGNQVLISFHSLFGDVVELAPRTATASSASVLTLEFPNTLAEVGRVLGGPVDVRVVADDAQVAHISWVDLVGLPASNDVTPIVLGEDPDQIVLAALGADGDIWVPTQFRGNPVAMPTCPGDFITPLPVQIAAAEIVGAPQSSLDPLSRIRQVDCYLGDVVINGYDFYGMLLPTPVQLTHVDGTIGVSLCRLNDAIDVVVRVQGDPSFVWSPRSPFSPVAQNSSPIPLRLVPRNVIPCDGKALGAIPQDSFGNSCSQP